MGADWNGTYPVGPVPSSSATGSKRVIRGGSFISPVQVHDPLLRNTPVVSHGDLGFRLAFSNHVPKRPEPTAIPLTIAENQPIGAIVGEFNATDPDLT